MSTVVELQKKREVPLLRPHDPNRRTLVMAIINATPDSFSNDGYQHRQGSITKNEVGRLVDRGADIIDIGGQSTRPGAEWISAEEELDRVLPIVKAIRELKHKHPIISIDTFYSKVARVCIEAGADIINDVSAGRIDQDMLPTVAELGKTIVLMHMRGTPKTMTQLTHYPEGVLKGVHQELGERVKAALAAGILPWRIILDPGIGFAKNEIQNLELLRNLQDLRKPPASAVDALCSTDLSQYPWLLGTSRKGFIGKITGVQDASDRTYGTAAAVTASIAGGAEIVRVHDVNFMVETVKMADAIYRGRHSGFEDGSSRRNKQRSSTSGEEMSTSESENGREDTDKKISG